MKTFLKSILYGAVDLATAKRGIARVIGGERIRFPPRWCRYYSADYEPATFDFLRRNCKPGVIALDIGAHFGLFTIIMARLVGNQGKVISFEPTPLIRSILQRTVRLNGCEHIVEIRHEAVTRSSGEAMFFENAETGSNANSLIRSHRSRINMMVPTTNLDSFVTARQLEINCVKIDVEGAELDVLRGACETLKRCQPAVRVAIHPAMLYQAGGTMAELWEVFDQCQMLVSREGRALSETEFCRTEELFDVELLPCHAV